MYHCVCACYVCRRPSERVHVMCIFVCTCVCAFMCMYVCVSVRTRVCLCIAAFRSVLYKRIRLCVYFSLCVCVCMCNCAFVHVYLCARVYFLYVYM